MKLLNIHLSRKNIINIVSVLLTSALVLMNDVFTGNSFGQKLLLGLAFAFTLYWTVSIFVFLFKRSLYTSYTVVIQRYWKRALYLFWALELFLFGIYTYLILVAPTEVEWLLDQPQLFSSNWWDGNLFFNKLLPLLLIIILIVGASYVLLNLNTLLLLLISLTISILLFSVLFADTAQTYLYSMFVSGISWDFDLDSGVWLINSEVSKSRTVTQYMFLITVLKFWHTAFIVSFWLMTVMFLLQSPYTGQGAYASNKQNFFFLYGFAFIWLCFIYKSYVHYSYEYVYQWFFVNSWGLLYNNVITIFEPLLCLTG